MNCFHWELPAGGSRPPLEPRALGTFRISRWHYGRGGIKFFCFNLIGALYTTLCHYVSTNKANKAFCSHSIFNRSASFTGLNSFSSLFSPISLLSLGSQKSPVSIFPVIHHFSERLVENVQNISHSHRFSWRINFLWSILNHFSPRPKTVGIPETERRLFQFPLGQDVPATNYCEVTN